MSLVSADYGDSEEENDSLASDVVSEEDGEEEGIDDPSAADPFAAPPISVMAVPVVADLAQALVADAKRQSIASAPPNQPTVSSSSTDSGTVGSSAQRRINGVARCDQCSEHVAKYRCPACERLTCSLACTTSHKSQFKCDGRRERTPFIPLNQFSDKTLMQDYSYLEEVSRCVDMSKRDPLARPTPRLLPGHGNSHAAGSRGGSSGGFGGKGRASEATIDHQKERLMAKLHWMLKQDERRAAEPPAADASATPALPFATLPSSDYALVSAYLQQQLSDQALLPPPTRLLQRECRARGTLLRVMPAGMMRHADNTSTVHAKSKAIHWRVEWYFDALSLKHVDAKLHENLPWSVAFGSLLGLAANHEWTALPPVNAAAADLPAADKASVAAAAFDHLLPPTRRSTAVGSASIGAFGALQHQLGLLRGQSSLSDLALLIAAPEQPANRKRFIELPWHDTIKDSLNGHLLIEFPSVHVVLRSDAQALLLNTPERHSLRRIILAATTVMSSRTDHQQDRKESGDTEGSKAPQSRALDDAAGGDSQLDASVASATFASKRKSAYNSVRNVSGPRQSPQLAEKRHKVESAPIAAVESAVAPALAPPAARSIVQPPTVAHVASGTTLPAPLLVQQQQQPHQQPSYQQHQQQQHFQQQQQQQQGPVHYASPAAAAAAALSAFASAPSNQYPQARMYPAAAQHSMYQPYQNMNGLHFAPYHQMHQQQFVPRPGFPHAQLPPPTLQAGMFNQPRYPQNQAPGRPQQ